MGEEYAFDAFISYSHRDLAWGRWIQRKLEGYSIPRSAARERQESGKLRIFRDQTDLAGAELQASLNRELDRSRYLIVICSPASAASKWVNAEIQYFMSLGRANRIIPFIVSGEPFSENTGLECFPPALKEKEGDELLGVNVQEIGKNKAFLKVASILLDIRFNRLVDRARKRRLTIGLSAGAAALAVVSVVTALAVSNYMAEEKNRELTYKNYGTAVVSMFRNAGPGYADLEKTVKPEHVSILLASAEEGNDEAMLLAGDCYDEGWGVEQDFEKAFYWYLKSAEAGNVECMLAAAECYYTGKGTELNREEAVSWYLKAAERGSALAMAYIGECYTDGFGVEKDPAKAFEWYLKAANAGDVFGTLRTALCYRDGIGVEADLRKAFHWNRVLADKGVAIGMFNVALMYQNAMGTEENPQEAYKWYRKVAETGDPDGMRQLAWCIENGYGVGNLALEWYQRAAEAGSKRAAEDVERILAEQKGGAQ